jgi:hypothetical protein
VTLSGGAKLAVDGPVEIVLNGQLNAGGGAFLNPTSNPASLGISSSYAGADGVLLTGGSGGHFSIYAPTTSVALSGGSSIFGAVLGKTLAVSGGGAIHYDVQLIEVWAGYFNNP